MHINKLCMRYCKINPKVQNPEVHMTKLRTTSLNDKIHDEKIQQDKTIGTGQNTI